MAVDPYSSEAERPKTFVMIWYWKKTYTSPWFTKVYLSVVVLRREAGNKQIMP